MNVPGAFTSVDVFFRRNPELALALQARAGYQDVLLGPIPPTSGSPTGLANDGTAYTATVKVDGTDRAVSVVGSASQTFATLITEINADISTWATASLISGAIRITSLATGNTSRILITDSGANHLFASLTRWFQAILPAVAGESLYARWAELDGTTQSAVYSVMAAVDPTAIDWRSGSDAITFTGVTPQTLLGIAAGNYDLNVNVDGAGATNLTFAVKAGWSFQQLVDVALTPAVAALGAKVSMVGNVVRITSDTFGTASSVAITAGTSADILAALVAFSPANAPNETAGFATVTIADSPTPTPATATDLAADDYDFTLTVDGGAPADYTVTIAGATTLTQLAALMDTAATAVADVAAVGNTLVITSKTTGVASAVVVTRPTSGANPDLFDSLETSMTATITIASTAGTDADGVDGSTSISFPVTYLGTVYADWAAVLASVRGPTGFGPLFTGSTKALVDRGPKPNARGDAVTTRVYWNGSAWKYFNNDVTIGDTVNPPEL